MRAADCRPYYKPFFNYELFRPQAHYTTLSGGIPLDYKTVRENGGDIVVTGLTGFDLGEILDNGQCFRWRMRAPGLWEGVAHNRLLRLRQEHGTLVFYDTDMRQFDAVWKSYFDFGRNYADIRKLLSRDPVMKKAISFAPGLRLLRQDPWEALCSFIFSQNNNIPRIKGIIERFCESFGEPAKFGEGRFFTFPLPEKIAALSPGDMAEVRAGFRAKYIIDAAKKVSSGEVDLARLPSIPIDRARQELMGISGVGPKVADCVLLFGLGHMAAFPADVWIGRAMEKYYPNGLPQEFLPIAGIAQQYLFHYARNTMRD